MNSTNDPETYRERQPPVVIALADDGFANNASDIAPHLENYQCRQYQQYQYGRPLAFFVREDVAGERPPAASECDV